SACRLKHVENFHARQKRDRLVSVPFADMAQRPLVRGDDAIELHYYSQQFGVDERELPRANRLLQAVLLEQTVADLANEPCVTFDVALLGLSKTKRGLLEFLFDGVFVSRPCETS